MSFHKHLLTVCTLPVSLLLSGSSKNKVGGQAVIEGVMMRGKQKISWAIRRPNGKVIIEHFPFLSLCKANRVLALPVLRGVINLFESFKLGYKALSRSADIAAEEEMEKKAEQKEAPLKEKLYSAASMVFAFMFSLGLFMYAPMWTISQVVPEESSLLFNLSAGGMRIALFLAYLAGISMWKEVRRVFEYHGAEHKAIFTYEDGKELTFENMDLYPTVHPRCGTSFLILVAICSILLFSVIDSLYIQFFGPFINVLHRVIIHLLLVPLVGGVSYEVLKLSDKYQDFPIVGFLIKPGLWLQRITTRKPDSTQLEIASSALKAAL
ncbi:MAG: DUF1385 domain-containing protein [Chitinispirillaceae bacterium]